VASLKVKTLSDRTSVWPCQSAVHSANDRRFFGGSALRLVDRGASENEALPRQLVAHRGSGSPSSGKRGFQGPVTPFESGRRLRPRHQFHDRTTELLDSTSWDSEYSALTGPRLGGPLRPRIRVRVTPWCQARSVPSTCSWAKGELLGFDLETTGVDRFSDLPVSYALVRMAEGVVVEIDAGLVDPGCVIPEAAVQVHGITTDQARAEGMELQQAVEHISDALLDASFSGMPVVGMNLSYDLTMVDLQYRIFTGMGLGEQGWNGPALDALTLDRHVVQKRAGKRRLESLCLEYGVELDAAHDAEADALAAIEVVMAIAQRYPEVGDTSPGDLHPLQVQWHREWATEFDGYVRGKGEKPLDPSDYVWPISWQMRRSAVA